MVKVVMCNPSIIVPAACELSCTIIIADLPTSSVPFKFLYFTIQHFMYILSFKGIIVKIIYSEKAAKFENIIHDAIKKRKKIFFQIFESFSKYINFTKTFYSNKESF